jgi:hypothetical protein
VSFECEEILIDEEKMFQIRSQPQMGDEETNSDENEENDLEETDSPSRVIRGQYDPDWDPSSRYLWKKLRADNKLQGVTYQLRTRQNTGSGPEGSRREELSSGTNSLSSSDVTREAQIATRSEDNDSTDTAARYTYNLRSRD